jgi:hypothetical protein
MILIFEEFQAAARKEEKPSLDFIMKHTLIIGKMSFEVNHDGN